MITNLMMNSDINDFNSNFANTTKLLTLYRPIKLQMELSQKDIEIYFGDSFLISTKEFLKNISKAGINPNYDKELSSRIFILNQNQKMLEIIDNSMYLLKRSIKAGKEDFLILHYSYIYKEVLKTKDILNMLKENEINISNEYFYQRRKRAIKNFEKYVFGFYSNDVMKIINGYYDLLKE